MIKFHDWDTLRAELATAVGPERLAGKGGLMDLAVASYRLSAWRRARKLLKLHQETHEEN